ncbi:hypothetical protein M3223_05635 [Paenibacillus pasadenensis]|nr:hypothetical protein [Paenibacillus pasadenensis]
MLEVPVLEPIGRERAFFVELVVLDGKKARLRAYSSPDDVGIKGEGYGKQPERQAAEASEEDFAGGKSIVFRN